METCHALEHEEYYKILRQHSGSQQPHPANLKLLEEKFCIVILEAFGLLSLSIKALDRLPLD